MDWEESKAGTYERNFGWNDATYGSNLEVNFARYWKGIGRQYDINGRNL